MRNSLLNWERLSNHRANVLTALFYVIFLAWILNVVRIINCYIQAPVSSYHSSSLSQVISTLILMTIEVIIVHKLLKHSNKKYYLTRVVLLLILNSFYFCVSALVSSAIYDRRPWLEGYPPSVSPLPPSLDFHLNWLLDLEVILGGVLVSYLMIKAIGIVLINMTKSRRSDRV